jgi:hypothetical protein
VFKVTSDNFMDVCRTSQVFVGVCRCSPYSQGQWMKAEGLKIQVMEAMKSLFGAEHPDTVTSMANLAATGVRDSGRKQRAWRSK